MFRPLDKWAIVLVIISGVLGIALLSMVITSCSAIPIPVDVISDSDVKNCAAACENLERLECPGWAGSPGKDGIYGTKDDTPCVELCVIVTSEPFSTLFPKCTFEAETCDQINSCFD